MDGRKKMKKIIYMNQIDLGKILEMAHRGCSIELELTKGLEERWVDACIHLNSEQMKAFHRIMVRDNINYRGFLETHELVKNYHGCNFDAWVEKKRK